MNKFTLRMVHYFFKIYFYFLPWRIPTVVEGPGTIKKVPGILKKLGFKKTLIVTDKTIRNLGVLDKLFDAMQYECLEYAVYDSVEPNPTEINVEEALKIYLEQKCDCLIAVGGGSSIDCCKVVGARVVNPHKTVAQMLGMHVKRKIPTMVAVPTTSGTGSETTMFAVITDSKTHHKAGIGDLAVLPDYAVLDPELVTDLPPFVTAITGMDALSHAVEAYTNHLYTTKLECQHAKKAIKTVYDYLYKTYLDGNNLENRMNMQKAAFNAGVAFNRGMTGYVHCIGHTLSGLYNVPHGLSMGVILPYVMKLYGPSVYKRLSELADVCGLQGKDADEKTLQFILWIEQLNEKMGLPKTFDIIQEEDIPQMIEWAQMEAKYDPTPQIWDKEQFEKCFRSIMS